RSGTRIHIWPPIGIGPAIEAALPNSRDIVRHKVRSEFVALVERGPEQAGVGLNGERRGVAKACGVRTVSARRGIHLPHSCSILLSLHAALRDVTVGADADIEETTILARRQRLRPVMIDLGRQVGDLDRRSAGAGLASAVREA